MVTLNNITTIFLPSILTLINHGKQLLPSGYPIGLFSITFTCDIFLMSITCASILNQDFTGYFSQTIIDILKNSSLKSSKMMLIMEIGNDIPLKFIQDLDTWLQQDL